MVKPRPSAAISTPGTHSVNAVRSPVFQLPLMNCTIRTGMRLPAARSASPMAAVDFPLPLPVKTRMTPRRFFLSSGSNSSSGRGGPRVGPAPAVFWLPHPSNRGGHSSATAPDSDRLARAARVPSILPEHGPDAPPCGAFELHEWIGGGDPLP